MCNLYMSTSWAACMQTGLCLQAACFDVFQLERPTPEEPYIKGLLDPLHQLVSAPCLCSLFSSSCTGFGPCRK